MAGDIRRIVRQSAQRECVFVDVLALDQQLANKVSATDVVHQIAELPATERVVAEILDEGASVGVGMRFFKLVCRQSGKPLEDQRLDLIAPQQVDDLLVSENRVCRRSGDTHQNDEQKYRRRDTKQAPPLPRDGAWRYGCLAHGSDPAENHQNDNNEKD